MTPIEETSPESVIAGNDPQSPALFRPNETVSGFMLGRGILANPFLAEQIKINTADACDASLQPDPVRTHCVCPSQPNDKTERLHAYLLDLYEDRLQHAGGSPKVLGRMKELWSYLMNSFEEPQVVWRKIKKINALKEYEEAVEYIFRNISLSSPESNPKDFS